EGLIARILRVDGNRSIAEHRLGASGRKTNELVGIFDWVAKCPETAFDGFVVNLVVRHGGLELRVPVDQALAAIDQAVLKHVEKRLPDGTGADRVEREAGAGPVATAAELAELAEDALFVLFLPLPDTLDQLFAANIVAGLLLFLRDALFDHGLR